MCNRFTKLILDVSDWHWGISEDFYAEHSFLVTVHSGSVY